MDIKEAVKEYQCSGCVNGPFEKCYDKEVNDAGSCQQHCVGTMCIGIGQIFLGMPKGFNRLGEYKTRIFIFNEPVESSNKFNIPVWKHLDKFGNTIIRGFRPRLNEPFIHIYLGNFISEINCYEVTEEDLKNMD